MRASVSRGAVRPAEGAWLISLGQATGHVHRHLGTAGFHRDHNQETPQNQYVSPHLPCLEASAPLARRGQSGGSVFIFLIPRFSTFTHLGGSGRY